MPAKRKDTTAKPDPLSLALGERVARLRGEAKLTPVELAGRAGMDPNYLWRVEEGYQNLSFRNVARLANALGVTLSVLVETIDVGAMPLGKRAYVKRSDAADGAA